jgi:hypothetical protein
MRDDKLWARGSHALNWDGMGAAEEGVTYVPVRSRVLSTQRRAATAGVCRAERVEGRLGLDGRWSRVARCVQGGRAMGDGRCWWLKRLAYGAAVGVAFDVVKRFGVGLTLYSSITASRICVQWRESGSAVVVTVVAAGRCSVL